MIPLNFTAFPELESERTILRRIVQGDATEMFFLRSDERVMKYIDRPRAINLEDAIRFIERIDQSIAANEGINWGIQLRGKQKLIGYICLINIQKENHRAEIGYALHPEYQGKGIMQESLEQVIKYAFKDMRLHTLEANINPLNESSKKILERLKFTQEAYFRENYFFDGKYLDSAIYSLISTKNRE